MGSVTCSTKGLIQTGNLVSFYIGRSARKRTKPTNFSAVGFVQEVGQSSSKAANTSSSSVVLTGVDRSVLVRLS